MKSLIQRRFFLVKLVLDGEPDPLRHNALETQMSAKNLKLLINFRRMLCSMRIDTFHRHSIQSHAGVLFENASLVEETHPRLPIEASIMRRGAVVSAHAGCKDSYCSELDFFP